MKVRLAERAAIETPPLKKVLVVARSFPPLRTVGSSIRVVKFVKYLPAHGWLPVVLTIDGRQEYASQRWQGSAVLLPEIPPQVKVYRTAAAEPTLETLERIAGAKEKWDIPGRLVRFFYRLWHWASQRLLSPDPYVIWLPIAVCQGWAVARRERVAAIFATCPAYSVSLIGVLLRRLARVPLVLDFRDDWIDTPYYRSRPRLNRAVERRLESWAVRNAERVTLVTQSSWQAFVARYPHEPGEKFVFLPNGCDLEDYAADERQSTGGGQNDFSIVHAGLLVESPGGAYRRSPGAFFQAVRDLMEAHPELAEKLSISFTGRLPEATWQLVEKFNLVGSVRELGEVPTRELVRIFRQAGLLLAINYDGWETIVPGKLYEYWAAAGPPVLLLSGPGAARDLLEEHRLGIAAAPDDPGAIARAIWEIYRRWEAGQPLRVDPAGLEGYDRKRLAGCLAQILERVTFERRPGSASLGQDSS